MAEKKTAPKKSVKKTIASKKPVPKRTEKVLGSAIPTKVHSFSFRGFDASSIKLDKKRGIILITLLVIILAVYAFRGLFVAAIVNGQPITRFQIVQMLEKQGGKGALDSIITEHLIYQEAGKKNIQVTDEEINQELGDIEKQFEGTGQTLDDLLALQGASRADLTKQITLQKLLEKLVSDKIEVTDAEVDQILNAQQEDSNEVQNKDQQREQVREQLKQQKLGQQVAPYLEELKNNAKILYFVNYK